MSAKRSEHLWSLKEVAARCGLHRATITRLVSRGEFRKFVFIGGRRMIPESELARWQAAHTFEVGRGSKDQAPA